MIEWFTKNHVAANLFMFFVLSFGIFTAFYRLPIEIFPYIERETVTVSVAYPGASPEEIEEGITVRIEEAVQDLDGIEEIVSNSAEGSASISINLEDGYDLRYLLDDVKSRVDAIDNFPEEMEKPVVNIGSRIRDVITVTIAGDLSDRELKTLTEKVRDDLLRFDGLTRADIEAARKFQISIEVPELKLKEFNLTLQDIAEAVNKSSVDLSAGGIKTNSSEILLRTRNRAYIEKDFNEIVVLTQPDGSKIYLKDIANVIDGFEEDKIINLFNGKPSGLIEVYSVGDQNALDIAEKVKNYINEESPKLPKGVTMKFWRDSSKYLKARLDTLIDNAVQGILLILLILALFLRPAIAFWVSVGIPVAFMGGMILLPTVGATINIVSLFGFILVLGIVVDDAIVTGENIYSHLQRTNDPLKAAIEGTKEVSVPVIFGVLTTVMAFLPIFFIEGYRGAIFRQIPSVVIPVLLFSLLESKLVLPAHLKHLKKRKEGEKLNYLRKLQLFVANKLEYFIYNYYQPVLNSALKNKAFVMSIFIGISIIVMSLVISGRIGFIFFPRVESEIAKVYLTMPVGTPFEVTERNIVKILTAAEELKRELIDPESNQSIVEDMLATIGSTGGRSAPQTHKGRIFVELVPPENRSLKIGSSEFVRQWRKKVGEIPGAEELYFRAEIGRGGDPINVQLSGNNVDQLREISILTREILAKYPNVFDIQDSFSRGKEELQLKIKEEAETLGIGVSDLARQVRQAFYGIEAQSILRGRDEIQVMIRYSKEERRTLDTLNSMEIKTPDGTRVPFSTVAEITPSISPSSIRRVNRFRTINVTADANKKEANIEAIKNEITQFLDQLLLRYPGVRYSLEGEAKEQREAFSSFWLGLLFVLFAIYCLLAIPFKSYLQPFIVMSVIPFGIVGAILGHVVMWMDLTILSFMGMLALIGVVVNDSLVMVDYINRKRLEGTSVFEAVSTAGAARFRPILLTSLTTFIGLVPLIFNESTQAQFLIPMAVSLGFGVLFATFVTLFIIPINYLFLEKVKAFFGIKTHIESFEKELKESA